MSFMASRLAVASQSIRKPVAASIPPRFPNAFHGSFFHDQTNNGFFVLDPGIDRAVVRIALFCNPFYHVCPPIGI